MKIALAQINATIADFRGNLEKIKTFSNRAKALGAELVVFPEQSIAGYPALDLWEEPSFIRKNTEALETLARQTRETALIVGLSVPNKRLSGKPIHNAAAFLYKGRVRAVRHKTLLPTYDVFDEARYFEPAKSNSLVKFKGAKLGITICEDAWSPEKIGPRKLYLKDPVLVQARARADILINISASPFVCGKIHRRLKLLSQHSRSRRTPFFYCNMTGGNDEIVFDGRSCVFDSKGRLIKQAAAFKEDLLVIDSDHLPKPISHEDVGGIAEIESALVLGIKDYLGKSKLSRVFIGLSGGIDSAVVCALAVKALDASSVTGVSMPSLYSSQGSISDAQALAENLKIPFLTIPITPLFDAYREALKSAFAGKPENSAEQNIQARIRGNLLMALANKENGIVLSTGNKSELSTGYCTLYGDMSGGLSPLADVPKQTVYALARWINQDREIIPKNSMDKPPSAELKFNQKDQDDLPPYPILDQILKAHIEDRMGLDEISQKGFSKTLIQETLRRIERAEHKRRQAAPAIKISPKAFGVGRRMPIARGTYLDETP